MSKDIPVNKWVHLSVRKLAQQYCKNLPIFFEEQTKDNNQHTVCLELRIDGPDHTLIGTQGENELYMEVNIGCFSTYNQRDTVALIKLTDVAVWILKRNICIYKLGDEAGDDKSLFGMMRLIVDDRVKVANFGQIDNHTKFYQASVEAHYELRYVDNGTV